MVSRGSLMMGRCEECTFEPECKPHVCHLGWPGGLEPDGQDPGVPPLAAVRSFVEGQSRVVATQSSCVECVLPVECAMKGFKNPLSVELR